MNDVLDLARPVSFVDDNCNCTESIRAKDGGNCIGAAFEKDADTLARLNTAGSQCVGKVAGAKTKQRERRMGIALEDGCAFRIVIGSIPEDSSEIGVIIRHGKARYAGSI